MILEPLRSAGGFLVDLIDTLRAFQAAAGFGIESLAGLSEAARRVVAWDFHPAVIWSFYAANSPDKTALVQGERRFTWREANERINRLANALHRRGVGPGESVAVMLHNRIEWFEVMAACQKIGAATVFVSYRSTPPELRFVLDDSGAATVVLDAENAAVLRRARPAAPVGKARAIAVGEPVPRGFSAYEALLAGGDPDEPPVELRRGASRSILYTSGTTGRPKGAVRDVSRAGAGALLGLLRRIPFRRSDRHLVAAPLYHATASGFAFIHAVLGATIAVLPRFDPLEFLRTVERERITTTALVPTMLRAVLDLPARVRARHDTRSLRIVVSTGSALPPSLERAARDAFGEVLYDLYGSTEMAYVAVATPQDKRACPGTIGRPIPGVDVVLLDESRKPVADGEVGELFAHSDLTVEGYHGNAAATRDSRYGDYFSVGDLAVRDPRGYLRLVGRKSDMVISGGMNVYPAEIEAVLAAHPAIRESAVVGVPDERWGESLVAFVVAKPGKKMPSASALVAFCKRSLAGYKVPRRFEKAASLPRNPTGKVLKADLRSRIVEAPRRAGPGGARRA
jgi:long-chain acyl-CoA synthetase